LVRRRVGLRRRLISKAHSHRYRNQNPGRTPPPAFTFFSHLHSTQPQESITLEYAVLDAHSSRKNSEIRGRPAPDRQTSSPAIPYLPNLTCCLSNRVFANRLHPQPEIRV
jgi:hypothetical protein